MNSRQILFKKISGSKIFRYIGLQRLLRLGIRYRIIFNLPKQNLDFTVPFFGYRYEGNLNDYVDKYVFYFGAYEREELLYLKKYLSKDSVVLDIGANTGHHSMFFSRFAKKVYSFEPYKKPFDTILKRIDENDIKNITAFNIGLGSSNSELDFYAPLGENGGAGSFIPSFDKKNIGKLVVKKGDDFIKNLNIEKINLIKIDVEGLETEVLEGLKQTIIKDKPIMFIEMTPESQTELDTTISNLYNMFIVDANNPFLIFFNKPGCKIKKFVPRKTIENILFIPKI